MILKDIIEKLDLKKIYVEDENTDITKGYSCDLLSEVMGKAESGCIWITVHTNHNVLGVAVMLDINTVIISEGYEPDENFIEKAKEEGINILCSNENNFTLSGKLYSYGIR